MTAGESATPDFDFESIVYGSGIVDQGMVEYLQDLAAYERAINGEGGKASMGYESILRLVNKDWPQDGVVAEVSGRLYLFGDIVDTDVVEVAIRYWGQPTREGDKIYWDVSSANLVSRGIMDDGDESTVRLACAFAFEGEVAPSFTTGPNEHTATYERLTKQGGEQYLRREWAELVEAIDAGLPENSFDTEALLQLAKNIAEVYQDTLKTHENLRPLLSDYITTRAEFSPVAPYALVLQGKVHHFDEEEQRTPLHLPEPTLEYVYRPVVVFQYANRVVTAEIIASSGEGINDENLLAIPSAAIREFKPTYTGTNLIDRVGQVGDFEAGNGEVEHVEDELTTREERLGHLRDMQMGIMSMIEQTNEFAFESYDTPEEAFEAAESGLYSIQSIARGIGLEGCPLVVCGEGVMIPPLSYELNDAEDDILTIKRIGEAYPMDLGDDRLGHFEDIQPAYRIMEEDGEDVYYPSIVMRLQLSSRAEETTYVNDIAMTEIAVSTYIHAQLESATIAVERLDAEERIDQTLHELDREGEAETCDLLEDVYAEFFDSEGEEVTNIALEALHELASYSATDANEATVKSIVTVVDAILNNQEVAINTTDDLSELVAGTVVDVKFERNPNFPPEGLVLTLAGADGSLHNVAASSVKTIVLRGNA